MLSLGNIIRKTQPTLFWCMRSLSKPKREAVFTLFAFCRHLDLVARSAMPQKEKCDLLRAWREELDNIYDKKVPQTNIGRKIYKNCMRFNLPKELWQEILDSAFLKAERSGQIADKAEFECYVKGCAEVPLRLALMIIAPEHLKAGEQLAKNLGYSVLLTYMLRDVKDDAQNGQFYIPAETLKNVGIELKTPREVVENKNFVHAREVLAAQVEKRYANAERLLAKMNYADTRVLRFLFSVGQCQFYMMKKRGWEIISPKPKVGLFKRLNIFYQTIFG